jgi:hypothetical protein
VEFLLDGGQNRPRIRRDDEQTTPPEPHRLSRRWRLLQSRAIERWAHVAEQFDVHPNQITSWKAQLEGGIADVFGPGGGSGAVPAAIDVKSLHAKIGELTLENDVLRERSTRPVC